MGWNLRKSRPRRGEFAVFRTRGKNSVLLNAVHISRRCGQRTRLFKKGVNDRKYRRVIFFWTFPVFAANVPAMMRKNIRGPDDIAVRPVLDPAERDRWDETMRKHHYLEFRGMVGEAVRHVAVAPDGEWLALLGWKAAAWRLRARDRWIGWTPEQRGRRLHLVANNARLLILPPWRQRNLASRILSLSTQRLSADFQAAYGHPVLMAETFVDPDRFEGTCYQAASWRAVGFTKGFERISGGGYREHGTSRKILMFELEEDARKQLCMLSDNKLWNCKTLNVNEIPDHRMGSLYEYLSTVPDFRSCRGQRYQLATVLAIAIAAQLCGFFSLTAIADFSGKLKQSQLAEVRSWMKGDGIRTAPSYSTFHRVLSNVDPEALDKALHDWSAQYQDPNGIIGFDGKAVRGASRQGDGCHLVGAVEHETGLICGQVKVADKSNEIPAARKLLRSMQLSGRIVTADAMHTQVETTQLILDRGADYLMVVKGNQKTILDDLKAIDWNDQAVGKSETMEKTHGRIDTRSCLVVELDKTWDGYVELPGRRQAFRIERARQKLRKGKIVGTTSEIAYGVTSIPPSCGGPAEILDIARRHWEIENRVHHVRDMTYDEDRRRNYVGGSARALASIRNAAISIVRLRGRFDYLPQAHRHYDSRQAVRELNTEVF